MSMHKKILYQEPGKDPPPLPNRTARKKKQKSLSDQVRDSIKQQTN